MELLRYGILLLSMCLCMFVRPSTGNAWMMDPPSRSAAWNYEIKAPINYDFRTLNCGNEKVIQPIFEKYIWAASSEFVSSSIPS